MGSTVAAEGSLALSLEDAFSAALLNTRVLAGYYIAGSSELVGGTYAVHIFSFTAIDGEAVGLFGLSRALQAEALSSGAAQLQIYGYAVVNTGILAGAPVLAARLGYSLVNTPAGMAFTKLLGQ